MSENAVRMPVSDIVEIPSASSIYAGGSRAGDQPIRAYSQSLRLMRPGIQFFQDLRARAFYVDFEHSQHSPGDAFAFAEQSEEHVFGTDVGMVQSFGFFGRKLESLQRPRC